MIPLNFLLKTVIESRRKKVPLYRCGGELLCRACIEEAWSSPRFSTDSPLARELELVTKATVVELYGSGNTSMQAYTSALKRRVMDAWQGNSRLDTVHGVDAGSWEHFAGSNPAGRTA